MKRSEMLARIAVALCDNDTNEWLHGEGKDLSYDDMARIALKVVEQNGMLAPKIEGVYDSVPTVTPTGNLDYSWKRDWEDEKK